MKYLVQDTERKMLVINISDDLVPTTNQIKIATQASGVNRADLLQLAGKYPPPAGESDIIGLEVSGVVITAPVNCKFNAGDKVMALLSGGGYAEQVCVDAGSVMKIPGNLSFIEAAAIPEAFITAYQALFAIGLLNDRLSIKPVRVLIHAGASGVGSAAIQLASLVGAEVFTTASSSDKLKSLKQLGADHLINYQQDNFKDWIKSETAGQGIDIIVDFIGGSYLNDNIDTLARDGVLVSLAMLGGRFAEQFDFAKLLAKRLKIEGSTLRHRDIDYKTTLIDRFSQQFIEHFASGRLKPVIDSDYRYENVAIAHQKMSQNQNIGKLVLHSFD